MSDQLEQLVRAAVLAPSGDNTQPWRFEVDARAQHIDVHLDPTRDRSPMNSSQRMARIAIGAAIENIVHVILRSGCACEIEVSPSDALARVCVSIAEGVSFGIPSSVKARVTNRRAYDGRALSGDFVEKAGLDTAPVDGVNTLWIVERDRIEALANLIGRGDAAMFGEPSMLKAFLAKVRFDAAANEEVDEGLSLASLEAGAGDRVALRVMRRLPERWLGSKGLAKVFERKARTLVESASGLCLVIADDGGPEGDVRVGRAMQRAWLNLTAEELSVQPMMSLPVLENALENGSQELVERIGRDRLKSLLGELRKLVPEAKNGRPAALLRFGYASPPSGRTGRLPIAVATTTDET